MYARLFIRNKLSAFNLDVSRYFAKYSLECFLGLSLSFQEEQQPRLGNCETRNSFFEFTFEYQPACIS